jgi:septal ring factor EnvC (AmiA/AmiB activator)
MVPQTMAAGWGGTGRVMAARMRSSAMPLDCLDEAMADVHEASSAQWARDLAPALASHRSVDALLRKNPLDRDVNDLSEKAQAVAGALQEHAYRAEHDLDAIKQHFSDLQSALASIQKTVEALRRQISELESRTDVLRAAAMQALETGELQPVDAARQELVTRLADLRALLSEAEELLTRLNEGRVPLGHLQDVARKWARAIMGHRG